ncbi:hypothetical protein ESZ50_02280 [Weissella muntiaci]|uniref:Uncharacterized protein n=1 Tax=Weissella muntiaci TaxID=2508881 RepID=A0A6C2CBS4_9LACO|nr:hypothetical protein [Weissella muntiaci]TYC50515.1 hypothetical protein ESZ50_02280 [Weissella muntiaci]
MDQKLKKVLLFFSEHTVAIMVAILGGAVILTIITAALGKATEMSVYLSNVNAILFKLCIILAIILGILVVLLGIKVYFQKKNK